MGRLRTFGRQDHREHSTRQQGVVAEVAAEQLAEEIEGLTGSRDPFRESDEDQ